jgi:dihydrofolate reductase
MGLLTFGLNLTLDGCCDHREAIADDELHDHFTQLMDAAGAMLWGRTTYEMMETAWPAVARDENAPRAMREWAQKLEAKPKYVVSASRRDFPWNNTFRLEGDLHAAVTQLKQNTPRGVLVGSHMLATALERMGLIDESSLRRPPGSRRPWADLVPGPRVLAAPRAALDEALRVRGDGPAPPPCRRAMILYLHVVDR